MGKTQSKIAQALPELDIEEIKDLADHRDMLESLSDLGKSPQGKVFIGRMQGLLAQKMAQVLASHLKPGYKEDIHAHLAELNAYSLVVGELVGADVKIKAADDTLDEWIEERITAARGAFETLTKKQ